MLIGKECFRVDEVSYEDVPEVDIGSLDCFFVAADYSVTNEKYDYDEETHEFDVFFGNSFF